MWCFWKNGKQKHKQKVIAVDFFFFFIARFKKGLLKWVNFFLTCVHLLRKITRRKVTKFFLRDQNFLLRNLISETKIFSYEI